MRRVRVSREPDRPCPLLEQSTTGARSVRRRLSGVPTSPLNETLVGYCLCVAMPSAALARQQASETPGDRVARDISQNQRRPVDALGDADFLSTGMHLM